jgi:hypothetical protein
MAISALDVDDRLVKLALIFSLLQGSIPKSPFI